MGSVASGTVQSRRRPFRQTVLGGLCGRCPNCGRGPIFRSRFAMLEQCPVCHLTYWPESGYYVGAMYLDFIASFLLIVPAFVASVLYYPMMASLAAWKMVVIWVCGLALVPIALMRWCYGLWLSLDFWLNPWEAGKSPELLSR
jgi:uncharacterized protein (DUF983 family)